MKLSEYLKPALGVAFVAVLAVSYYWFEHRPRAEEKDTPGQALVIVTKSTNACFSDMVRVTGFIVPRREAQVGVDQEGSRVTDLFVKEGDTVETRRVRVGLTSDTSTEILEGLDVGETVVADAGTSLHDGDQIKTMFADELDRTRTR